MSDCDLSISGESFYRKAFRKICGAPKDEGEDFDCVAAVIPESDNQYDANAVRVDIAGQTVGYLSRDSAVLYRKKYGAKAYDCRAHISAGWSRPGDRGDYCVRLALDLR